MKNCILTFLMIFSFQLINSVLAQDWKLQTNLTSNIALYSVKTISRDIAWTVGDRPEDIYRTTNAGQTWVKKTRVVNSTTELPVTMEAIDSTIAFVGTANHSGNAGIYRTTDGGQSWHQVYLPSGSGNNYWNWVHFFDSQNGIAECDQNITNQNFFIVKTTNGGVTWTPIAIQPTSNQNEYGIQNSVYFFDSLNGWFGTGPLNGPGIGGRVFRTTDGGNTWVGVNSGNNGVVRGISFISPLVGVRTSEGFPFLTVTSDGGQTWNAVINLPVPNITIMLSSACIITPNKKQIWLSGAHGSTNFILTSIDDGLTWLEQTVPNLLSNVVYDMSTITFGVSNDSVQAFAVTTTLSGGGGLVLNYLHPVGFVTDVGDETKNIPIEYSLSQNFPNPFNPSTTISWQSPVGSWQTLKIYDMLGNEVATLVDEYREAGKYEVEFNAKNLANGMYLYRIQTGSFAETKKMILLR